MSIPPDAPQTPAGWYPDPTQDGQQRYWDGAAWTEHTAPGGAAPAGGPGGAPNLFSGALDENATRNWAVIAHLSCFLGALVALAFLGPLVVWLIQRDQNPFVADQAREALNFHLSLLIYAVVAGVGSLFLIGIPFLIVIALMFVIVPIIAAVKASNGEAYRYPLTLRLVS